MRLLTEFNKKYLGTPDHDPTVASLGKSFYDPSTNHSFHQDTCFETTYMLILKSGFFEPFDVLVLHRCHLFLLHLLCACVHLCNCNFLWVAEYNMDWAKQGSLRNNKAYAFLSCLLH